MLNLDTHMVVYALTGQLRPAEQTLLEQETWSISAIVLWELAKISQLGRINVSLEDREVVSALGRLHVWPIGLAVALGSTRLDFRGDPADELIAATSVVHGVPLMTRDPGMRRSELVPTAL